VDDFRPVCIVEQRPERLQSLAFFIKPHGTPLSGLRKPQSKAMRARILPFALPPQDSANRQGCFARSFARYSRTPADACELRVSAFHGRFGIHSADEAHRLRAQSHRELNPAHDRAPRAQPRLADSIPVPDSFNSIGAILGNLCQLFGTSAFARACCAKRSRYRLLDLHPLDPARSPHSPYVLITPPRLFHRSLCA